MRLSMSPPVLSHQVAQQEANGLMSLLLRSFNSPNSKSCQEPRNPLSAVYEIYAPSQNAQHTSLLCLLAHCHYCMVPDIRSTVSGLSIYFRGESANNQEANSHASHIACIIPVAPEGLAPLALTCIHLDAEYNQGIWVRQARTSLKDLRHPIKCFAIQILKK